MMLVFLRELLFKKIFSFKVIYSLYVIPKKLRFQCSLSIACYKETKFVIIDCVSVIPIGDLTDILS